MSLTRPRFEVAEPSVSVGAVGQGGLSFQATRFVEPFAVTLYTDGYSFSTNNLAGRISLSQTCTYPCGPGNYPALATVQLGNISDQFTAAYFGSPGGATPLPGVPVMPSGSSLTYSVGTNEFIYTSSDGTRLIFEGFVDHTGQSLPFWDPAPHHEGLISRVEKPDGEVITWNYTHAHFDNLYFPRLQSVTNNLGYQIHIKYKSDAAANYTQLVNFRAVDRVTAINNTVYACAATATSCLANGGGVNWPYLQYTSTSTKDTVTDGLGQVTAFYYEAVPNTGRKLVGVNSPQSEALGQTSYDVSLTWGTSATMYTLINAAGTWNYSYNLSSVASTYLTITRPNLSGYSRQISMTQPTAEPFITWSDVGYFLFDQKYIGADTLNGRTTTYHYDNQMRVDRVTRHDGDYTEYTYDARRNVTQVRNVAKSGSGPADIYTYASYPESGVTICVNAKTCNKPTWVTIAGPGSGTPSSLPKTDFTFDSTHGGVLTETKPAPGSGPYAAIRPQTRYTYNTTGVVRVAMVKSCKTTTTCAGAADETSVETTYNTKRLPSQVVTRAGNNTTPGTATYSTVTMTYTPQGDVESVDGPLSGTVDKTWSFYDVTRRPRVTVAPDPDGAGSLVYRAIRTTYDGDGNTITAEQGSVTAPANCSDANTFCSSTMTVLAKATTAYDSYGRKIRGDTINVGTSQPDAVIQYSYDSAGHVECVATRMNAAVFVSLPGACTQSTAGSFGQDRIVRTTYTANGDPSALQSGYGTSLVRNERTFTYLAPGQASTVKDANNNLTTYTYDGFNRLQQTRYPVTTTGGNASSTIDYEELLYDGSGRVASERRRDGLTVLNTYDNLNRLTLINRPGTELDITNGYDNYSNLVSASQTGASVTWTYDALGRVLTEVQPNGTVSYAYDTAGRRTQLTYPGASFFTNYQYHNDGRVKLIGLNGATTGANVLATYYDDQLGRRASVCRGTGTAASCSSVARTAYGYDALSRLTSLNQDLVTGTAANDINWTLSYSPASQLVSRAASASTYEWPATATFSDNYAVNGLNQYTTVAGLSLAYDGRGNTTNDTTKTYTYDSSNRLTSASNGAGLAYDPTGRLLSIVQGASTTKFLYDGTRLIAEYNGSNTLLRRYVHGDGTDDPIVWYDSSGTTNKRNLFKDERGSVIASDTGTAVTTLTYDEYGNATAAGSAVPRFQYTGQTWISELNLNYYKARFYTPKLGRFMQTDPIGMKDQINLYAYVGNDPINRVDPLGEKIEVWIMTYPIDGLVGQMGQVHAFIFYEDTETGSLGIARAGPGIPGEGGHDRGYLTPAHSKQAADSLDAKHPEKMGYVWRTWMEDPTIVDVDLDTFQRRIDAFDKVVGDKKIPYQAIFGNNSNTYASNLYTYLTGKVARNPWWSTFTEEFDRKLPIEPPPYEIVDCWWTGGCSSDVAGGALADGAW